MKAVGASLPRYDGVDHVTGASRFVDDFSLPGMLWAKALRSPVASGRILRLDTARAATMPGVHVVITHSDVQVAFNEHYAAQCGFCTPGMLLAATALISRKGRPVEREEVVEALGGHYCRCTGYVRILDAVVAASRGERLGTMAPTALEIRGVEP